MSNRQPNSRHCFVCGLENPVGLHLRFDETGEGEVTASFTAPQHYQGYPGVVHGGIVAAMLDEVAGRALMSGYPHRFMFTARLDVRYRKNVPVGIPIRLVGQVTNSKERTATSWAAIYGPEGDVLAEAEALLVRVPDIAMDAERLEALGWKVYPDDDSLISSEVAGET